MSGKACRKSEVLEMYLRQQLVVTASDEMVIDTLQCHFQQAALLVGMMGQGNDDRALYTRFRIMNEVVTLCDDELTRRAMIYGGINNINEVIR